MSFDMRLAAAPMAGISNRTYRDIVRSMGADVAYGEMVSAQALVYKNKKTYELLDLEGEASPRMVQLFGAVPEYMAEAAAIVKELGAEYIDINMGCPVPKVVRNHEGSALMRDPDTAEKLVRAVSSAGLPVSVKIRSGWDENEVNAADFAARMEQSGAWLIAVHGRTREQYYTGRADRKVIAAVKKAVSVPVLANGDIFCAADALSMLEDTGCDGVMVGRGMLGDPWIFRDIKEVMAGRPPIGRPEPPQILAQALDQLREHMRRGGIWYCFRENDDSEIARRKGEELACHSLRNVMGWYMKGLRDAARLRNEINQLSTYDEIEGLLLDYVKGLGYTDIP